MDPPEIAVLLPYTEHFGPERAGAVALQVRDATLRSRFRDRIRVYGRPVPAPFPEVDFQPVEPLWGGRLGHNLGLAERFHRTIRGRTAVIELHNRPNVFHYLAARSRSPLTIRLANDPHTMRWARSATARRRILRRASAVYCVSAFVRERFLEGTGAEEGAAEGKVHVLYPGIARTLAAPPEKERLVVFAGRINEDKGVADLVSALERVLPQHTDWRAEILGSSRSRRSDAMTAYEAAIRARCQRLGGAVRCLGFLANDAVTERYRRAAIAVVPSRWPEPLGRTAMEALANGCAVIAYARGGLPEIVRGRGLLVERPTADALTDALGRVIADDALRQRLQARAWHDYPFGVDTTTRVLDDVREEIFERLARS